MNIKNLYRKADFLAALLVAFFASHVAIAQSTEIRSELEKKQKNWSVYTSLSSSSNFRQLDDPLNVSATSIRVYPTINLTKDLKLNVRARASQSHNSGTVTTLHNTGVYLAIAPKKITLDTTLIGRAGVILPTDEDSRKEDSFRTALVVAPTLITQLSIFDMPFTAYSGISVVKNFHRFERNSIDAPNAEYSLGVPVSIEKQIFKNTSLNLGMVYSYIATYQDAKISYFSLNQTLSYQLNNNMTLSIGHDNDSNIYKADGRSTNFAFFNSRSSVFFASLSASY